MFLRAPLISLMRPHEQQVDEATKRERYGSLYGDRCGMPQNNVKSFVARGKMVIDGLAFIGHSCNGKPGMNSGEAGGNPAHIPISISETTSSQAHYQGMNLQQLWELFRSRVTLPTGLWGEFCLRAAIPRDTPAEELAIMQAAFHATLQQGFEVDLHQAFEEGAAAQRMIEAHQAKQMGGKLSTNRIN